MLYNFTNSGGIFYGNYSKLSQGRDGALYGRSLSGGATAGGTIFRINTDGSGYADIATFPYVGFYDPVPSLGVIQGNDGAWYGTRYNGGVGAGTAFRLAMVPLQFTGINLLPGNAVQLSLTGASNCTCRIDVSTDLLNWSPLTNVSNVSGTVQFTDAAACNFAQRFYRAVWVP